MRMLQMLVLPLIVSSLITGEKCFLLLPAKTMGSKAVVRVPLHDPAGGASISLASSDKPKSTAIVNMIHTETPAGSVVVQRSRRPCAFSEDRGETQCCGSNAQHFSTYKDLILHNLKCLQVCCPNQLQVSSSLEKVNLCQSKRVEVDHRLEGLFHLGPQGRHDRQPSFQTAEGTARCSTCGNIPPLGTGRPNVLGGDYFPSERFKRKLQHSQMQPKIHQCYASS